MTSHRELPHNPAAERAVLGACLKSEQAFWQIADTLRADQFYAPLHQQIFGVVRDICTEGRMSLALVAARLPHEDDEGASIPAYLAVLLKDAEDAGSPADFAQDIADAAARRQLIALAESLLKGVKAGEKGPMDLAAEANAGLTDVMQVASPKRPRRLSEVVAKVAGAAKMASERDVLPGFGAGLPSLDEILGRILPGDLMFLMGAQGDGKSALAMQVGMHIARSAPVLVVQLEMTAEQVGARELAAASGITVGDIQEGAFDFAQRDAILAAQKRLEVPELMVLDDTKLTIRQIRSHCIAMKRTRGLGALIIDQLDKIRPEGRHKDRFERLAEVTGDLKVLAKDLMVPLIVLAQRTRGGQRREDPTPHLLDADAPSIERDADIVLAVWRRETWLRANRPNEKAGGEAMDKWEADIRRFSGSAQIITLKHRRRKTFEERTLKWIGELTRFEELE
ncbi:DnaB-like helicase C-terminal domain-containing protein [Xanthobacter sp. V0B-10]|uniref:replicative DNA helicase n=1 Tax=Xanthobacter albus TaxID=3119929 RepID=UPI00372BA3D0